MTIDGKTASTEAVRVVVDALGTAWTTFGLYPDVSHQPAFNRAVVALSEPITPPILVGVGPGRFMLDDEPVESHREGVGRLARRLFLHGVAHIQIVGGTTQDGLLGFFRVVALSETHMREQGGIRAALREVPATGVQVLFRWALTFTDVRDRQSAATILAEHLSPAVVLAAEGGTPEQIAEALVADSIGAPFSPEVYFAGLWAVYDQAVPLFDDGGPFGAPMREGDNDPWREFRLFLESFFFLPDELQLGILEAVLTDVADENHRLFLDQMARAELLQFAERLSEEGRESLTEYAETLAKEPGRPAGEFLGVIVDEGMLSAQKAVSERITEVLSDVDRGRSGHVELLAVLRNEMSRPLDEFLLAEAVIRGLLECEHRDDRFARTVRVWTARIARSVRSGDIEGGLRLLESILDDPPFSSERRTQVMEGLSRLASPDTLRFVLDADSGAEVSEHAVRFYVRIGAPAVDALVAVLAESGDQQARRRVTALLIPVVSQDPLILDKYLFDGRWYLLRNLATVLGKTGKQVAVGGARRLLAHHDHRVRVEALRAVTRLQQEEAGSTIIRMLSDRNMVVRDTAATLANNLESPGFEASLVRQVAVPNQSVEGLQMIVKVLGTRNSETANAELTKLAGRRFVFRKRARTLRSAARAVLGAAA